jgi:hypothetical protein
VVAVDRDRTGGAARVLLRHGAEDPAGKAIAWSEPEILLYDENLAVRISYPDFVEDSGRYFFTETQKTIPRVHEVPAEFLEMLWNQHTARTVVQGLSAVDDQSPRTAVSTRSTTTTKDNLRGVKRADGVDLVAGGQPAGIALVVVG